MFSAWHHCHWTQVFGLGFFQKFIMHCLCGLKEVLPQRISSTRTKTWRKTFHRSGFNSRFKKRLQIRWHWRLKRSRDEFRPLRYSIIFTPLTGGVTGLSISLQNCRTRKNLHSTRRIFQFNHWIQSIRDQYVRQVMKSANHPRRNHKYFQLKETKLISVTRHRRQGAQFGWAFHLILRS